MNERKRLRVLFVTNWFPDADNPCRGVFVKEHAHAAALYNKVTVLFLSLKDGLTAGWSGISRGVEDDIETIRFTQRKHRFPKIGFLRDLSGQVKFVRKLISDDRPDVIHAHTYGSGLPAVIVGKRNRIPVAVTEHWSGFTEERLPRFEGFKARYALNHAQIVLPVSGYLKRRIEKHGIEKRLRVVPNAIDCRLFSPSPRRGGRTGGISRFLLVALLTPVKGIPYLLQAVRALKVKRGGGFRLDIVGDGPNRAEYERLAAELDIDDLVTWHGTLSKPNIAQLMHRCDFFVLPSLSETFGCALAEAMACGLPFVATETGAVPEVADPRGGILVPPGDSRALEEAIGVMMERHREYSPEVIASTVCDRFSRETVGRMLDEVYRGLVHRSADSRNH